MELKTVRLVVEIPADLRFQVRMESARRKMTIKQLIVDLINKAIAKKGKES